MPKEKKRVILTLEYDMGDHSDSDEELPLDIEWWGESFFQSDAVIHDMDIIGVRIEK